MDWNRLLCDKRFSRLLDRPEPDGKPDAPDALKDVLDGRFRLPQERDHDRILFSTPFRRLGDKTQVFPLESIESIRTRLTHSFEVANLARSLGLEIASMFASKLPSDAIRKIPATLAAAGLAHDIGNPPFGHQGESAIRAWFRRNENVLFAVPDSADESGVAKDVGKLTTQHRNDFLLFEGNAQTLRVLTKLQVISDDLGLNLTLGTIATVMKYVAGSDSTDRKRHSRKKPGFFASEQSLVEEVRKEVGLEGDARHPLALVMEACDDIAYSVLDAEDAVKKGLVSLNDILATLEHRVKGGEADPATKYLCDVARWDLDSLRNPGLHPSELQDVATQKFRVHAIHLMVSAVAKAFRGNYDSIMSGAFDGELIEASVAGKLCGALKDFDRKNAYSHKSVLEIELNGFNVLNRLMDFLWTGISEREGYENLSSRRTSPFAAYVYSRISKNYRRVFEGKVTRYRPDPNLPIRYRELRLLTDMVSGMTDQFCLDLHRDLERHHRDMRTVDGKPA